MIQAKNRQVNCIWNLIRNVFLFTVCLAIACILFGTEGLFRIARALIRRAISPIVTLIDTYVNSRVNAGYVIIGVSILLFLIAGSMDDPEAEMSITEAAVLGNLVSITAVVLIGPGIYLWYFSKRCPVCRTQLSRAAPDCHYCRHKFETARRAHHWKWLHGW